MKEVYIQGWEIIRTIYIREGVSTTFEGINEQISKLKDKNQCQITPCKILVGSKQKK